MVEFAPVAVLLLTLVFEIIEFGLAFRDRLTISNVGQAAARVGTAVGNGDEADQVMLNALEQTLANLPSARSSPSWWWGLVIATEWKIGARRVRVVPMSSYDWP